jgi:hypothetical protein
MGRLHRRRIAKADIGKNLAYAIECEVLEEKDEKIFLTLGGQELNKAYTRGSSFIYGIDLLGKNGFNRYDHSSRSSLLFKASFRFSLRICRFNRGWD